MTKQLNISQKHFEEFCHCKTLGWLNIHDPVEVKPPLIKKLIKNQFEIIKNKLQEIFADCITIPHDIPLKDQIQQTQDAIEKRQSICSGVFLTPSGQIIHTDFLIPTKKHWKLFGLKVSSKVKTGYHFNISFQLIGLKELEIPIKTVYLIIIDKSFILNKETSTLKDVFKIVDITKQVRGFTSSTKKLIQKTKNNATSKTAPKPKLGTHCLAPRPCKYKDQCWKDVDKNSPILITGIPLATRFKLLNKGVTLETLADQDLDLTPKQLNQIQSHLNNALYKDQKALKTFVDQFTYPISYLDFEAFQNPVPTYQGTRPFQSIPFLYSLHVEQEPNGKLEHFTHLSELSGSARKLLLEALLEEIPEKGSILVYGKDMEISTLRQLATQYPEYKDKIDTVINRIEDLITPFEKGWIYHPKMNGSASLKDTAPALSEQLDYNNLLIQNGETASLSYKLELLKENKSLPQKLKDALINYCKLDTEALVKIKKKLEKIANE